MALRRILSKSSLITGSLNGNVRCMRSFASSSETPDSGPVYIVFGATGAVGQSLCKRLAAQPGSRVVISGRSQEKLDEIASAHGAHPIAADILDSKQVAACISDTFTKFGRVDGVTNCVGNIVIKPAHTTSDAEFMNCLNLNLVSSFNVLKGCVKPMMSTKGGSIVLCASAVVQHGKPNHEAIAAAKGGVKGMMLSAAATYAPHQIRVNCVAPGLTRSNMSSRIIGNAKALQMSTRMHALGRIGEADEVARAIEFLLHPDSSFITGQTLGVDGGLGSIAPISVGDK